VCGRVGQWDLALAAHRQAYDLRGKIHRAHLREAVYQFDFAQSHNNLGEAQRHTGQRAAALKTYRQARSLWQQLVSATPTDVRYLQGLAQSHYQTGDLLSQTGQPTGAVQAHRESLTIRQQLADAAHGNPQRQRELALSYQGLGTAYRRVDPEKALHLAQQAYQVFLDLHLKEPENRQFQADLAGSHRGIGILFQDAAEFAQALDAHRRALALCEGLVQKDPTLLAYRLDLAETWNDLGQTLEHLNRPEEAANAYRQAIAQLEPGFRTVSLTWSYRQTLGGYHLNLLRLLRGLDRPAEASQVALPCNKLWAGHPLALAELAWELALCISPNGNGEVELAEAKRAERRRLARQVAVTLQEAAIASYQVTAGWLHRVSSLGNGNRDTVLPREVGLSP
jgi:tetratricopeptide (TPR) repeat protein